MGSPLEQAGAIKEPSQYAALSMDRGITGLWTQRSPLRDADVPYLYGKFYSASRFDSLIDGINREIGSDLTWRRRPGSSAYNANSFPAANSMYSYKRIVNGSELVRLIYDGADGTIYDATAGQKSTVFAKSAGAGKARFQGVNTALYFTDGVENKKWLQPGPWAASLPPSFISSIQNSAVGGGLFLLDITCAGTPPFVAGNTISLEGLTTAIQFNGALRTVNGVVGSVISCQPVAGGSNYGPAGDTGEVNLFSSVSGPPPDYAVGSLVMDSNGSIEYLSSVQVGSITNVQASANTVILTFAAANFNLLQGMSFTPAGLGAAAYLNGQLLIAQSVVPVGATFVVTASFPGAPYLSAADSGTASTTDVGTSATTGTTQPTWNTAPGGATVDGLSTWTNFGNPVFDWGAPVAPQNPPTLTAISNGSQVKFWQPFTKYTQFDVLLDSSGNIFGANNSGISGAKLPNFEVGFSTQNPVDGGVVWVGSPWLGALAGTGGGNPVPWRSGVTPTSIGHIGTGANILVDTNGNVQYVSAGSGATGGSAPTWNSAYGGTTADSGLTWTNAGPYLALAFQGRKWGYAYHCIDGSVSTLSPLSPSSNALLGGAAIGGVGSSDPQVDSVWIFHTADGEDLPLFLAQIPNPGAGANWTFNDFYNDFSLVAELIGPQAKANNPPPIGMTAPIYHLGRMMAIFENGVIMSGGPNTLVGNGNTAFAPGSFFPIPEQPVRLFSIVTSVGPGLLVWGRANRWIILGQGTPNSPFQQAALYAAGGGILSYDAVKQRGSTFYYLGDTALIGGNVVGKVCSLDPGAGETEFGFPIGDQFQNVTTGAGGRVPNSGVPLGYLYNPANAFVAYAELGSGDTGIYIADGSVGWFRCSPVASPESGFLWSPRAVITGGTSAVQDIETQPGVTQLLIAPAVSGPITFRDSTTNADLAGDEIESYPSYDVKGCIQLCLSGEVGEIAHVHLVSAAVGARPSVGLLFGEVLPTTASPFFWWDRTCSEPPDLPESETLYSDRYTMLSKGVTPKCLFFQLGVDYGTQNFPDKLLMFSIYGAKYAERKQQ